MLTRILLAAALGLGGLTSCKSKVNSGSGKPLVVTTTTMATDLAQRIGGDHVEVRGLMGPEVDPHNYIPALSDTSLLERGDLIVYSGLHLEGRMQDTLEAMAKRGRRVVALSAGVTQDRLLAPQEGFEGTRDPHFWGDPTLWRETIPSLVKALSETVPAQAADFEAKGKEMTAELDKLDAWAKSRVAEIPAEKRVLITSHDAFFYFGRAYGFEVRGLQGVSTAAEAGLKDRTDLVAFIRSRGIRTLFGETSVNAKGIQAVADEAGAKLSPGALFSDAMGKPGDIEQLGGESYDRGTYVGMIKHNVNVIVEGLK
ncbi:zinc ABC transporter substrate-binding protein [Luteolibacter sp. Populi]|uniref:metal ABC transporter solute-binding protein, Zn/Mn family n=1 Tax=Luteolibacter sp. Populi TaxID=3230487 RepID=UPI00346524A7